MYVPGSEACKDAWKERKRSRHGAPIWSPSSHIVSARCRYGWHMRVTWFTHMYATCISSIVTGTVCICPFENRVLGQSSGGSAPWHLVRAGYCRTPDRATAAHAYISLEKDATAPESTHTLFLTRRTKSSRCAGRCAFRPCSSARNRWLIHTIRISWTVR